MFHGERLLCEHVDVDVDGDGDCSRLLCQVLKKGNHGVSGLSCRGLRSILTFFATGNYLVHQASASDMSYMKLALKSKTGDDDDDGAV